MKVKKISVLILASILLTLGFFQVVNAQTNGLTGNPATQDGLNGNPATPSGLNGNPTTPNGLSGNPSSGKCDPANFTESGGVCFPINTGLSDKPVKDIIINLMNWILGVFGFIAIIGFVIAGIMYLTSSGEEEQAKKAKTAMKWAIVGVIVARSGVVVIQAIDAALKATNNKF